MKKLFITALAVSLAANAFAIDNEPEPGMSVQLSGGMTISSLAGAPKEADLGAKVGGTLAIKGQYMLPGALGTYINASAAWTMKGAHNGSYKLPIPPYGETINATYNWETHYIQIPIHVGFRYNLSDKLGVYAEFGPYFSLGLSGKQKIKVDVDGYRDFSDSSSLFDDTQRTDFGLGFLIGGEFENHYSLNLGFDWGITDLYKDSVRESYAKLNPGKTLDKLHNFCATISVGYRF